MKWKHLFNPTILKRGYEFYLEEAIMLLAVASHEISAEVNGRTDDYIVTFSLEDLQVKEMACTCPYFKSDKNCKHLAATLWEVEALEEAKDTKKQVSRHW